MITIEHESRRPPTGTGFADAVTYSFGDAERGWYGLARLGLAADGKGSALAVLFHEREPIAATAKGDVDVPADADWNRVAIDALATETDAPLERWRATVQTGEHGFDLAFTAISAPAEIDLTQAGGMTGYEQLCAVEGEIRSGATAHAVSGLGQRGHAWGAPDWSRLALARNVCAWLGPEHGGIALASVRGEQARAHSDEAVAATLVQEGDPVAVADPRLSTTYDGEGRQRRAGLELWVAEEDGYPFRAAGEIVCGSTLDLGQLRMDIAFLQWHAEGQTGVGRYDIIRRA